MNISPLEIKLINRYQGGFPLHEHPFTSMARQLDCDEESLLQCIQQSLEAGTLTRFGPLYDAVQLGGGLTLAALSVPETRYDAVTECVNAFPQVAHNYRREHELNMWFVLATESTDEIDSTLQAIQSACALPVYNFPKQQEFYVGLWLHLDDSNGVATVPVPEYLKTSSARSLSPLDSIDRKIIQHTQGGIALTHDPWTDIATEIGIYRQDLLRRLQRMLANGIIRRIGAVPNHYRLGLKANGMTVWDVPDHLATEIGQKIGQLDFVSHCYLRPRHLPQWSYNLFAMVHGHQRDEVDAKADQIATLIQGQYHQREVLFSSAILKKTGMRLAA